MGVDMGTGVMVEAGVRGLGINGNTFSGLKTPAVWCTGEVKNVLISSNLCIGCGRQAGGVETSFAVKATAGVLIKDNLEDAAP